MSDKIHPTANSALEHDGSALAASLWERNGEQSSCSFSAAASNESTTSAAPSESAESKSAPTYRPSWQDLDSFRSGHWWQSNFSREEISAVANDPKVAPGGRQLASYLSHNFDDVRDLSIAGDERVHLSDIHMAIGLSRVQNEVSTILAAKDQLLSKFDQIDANGDNALSEAEMQDAISPAADRTLNYGMSTLLNRSNAFSSSSLFSSEVTRMDVQTFDEKHGFDRLARAEHYARTENTEKRFYTTLGLMAGALLAASPLYRGSSLTMKLLAVTGTANLTGLFGVDPDRIQSHYKDSTAPAAKRLFGM
jgi:hypothetical protein